jgi:sialate O-acetylesterase
MFTGCGPKADLGPGPHLRLPRLFADGAVLQRDMKVPVWGWAAPGDRITVELEGKTFSTTAGKDGRWQIRLNPMEAGGPYTLKVQGDTLLTVSDVLFGDVWICGGQSNMEMPMRGFTGQPVLNSAEEIASADFPEIRLFTVPRTMAALPMKDLTGGEWLEAVGPAITEFSAVGYFFGKRIHQETGVPVGLISSNWGGTVVETWTSSRSLKRGSDLEATVQEMESLGYSLEELKTHVEKRFEIWVKALDDRDQGYREGEWIWAAPDLTEQEWAESTLPGLWETAGHPELDGVVWYRKEIDVPAALAGKDLLLSLGKIDDSDITWFNGVRVGGLDFQYNAPRVYVVPDSLVRPGRNVIAVRVMDFGGEGGLYGDSEEFVLYDKDSLEVLTLAGLWKMRTGVRISGERPSAWFGPNSFPTLLYNGMIAPVIPFGIRGAIWYQGESNASRAFQYRDLFPRMIRDWRRHWDQGDFPFLFVQLAGFRAVTEKPGESTWAELREAQSMALALPNTGMAVAIDIGEADCIHPANKPEVGRRLALSALSVAYGRDLVFSGPVYREMRIEDGAVRILFDHTGTGLMAWGEVLRGFTIAGADSVFVPAQARIDGKTVLVSSPRIPSPLAVRYGWADNPGLVTLYNREGLPASPFRTDDWPGITESE